MCGFVGANDDFIIIRPDKAAARTIPKPCVSQVFHSQNARGHSTYTHNYVLVIIIKTSFTHTDFCGAGTFLSRFNDTLYGEIGEMMKMINTEFANDGKMEALRINGCSVALLCYATKDGRRD